MSTLPPMVRALLDPQAYPHKPPDIKLLQTQMSFVFLAGNFVYKVKKAVDLGYLNYSTLEKRRFYCHQELELNRRLCPDAYLAVVPISRERDGFRIEGSGKAVEYAVKMRRLLRECMLDVLLAENRVTREMITGVAERLVRFHRQARTDQQISSFGRLQVIVGNCNENFAQTEKYIGISIAPEDYQHIRDYADNFAHTNASLFEARVREGRVRDCHGDLHAAHVCLTKDICIYDCIEFNDRFRYSDVASELAFLAMDLDRYEQGELSQHLVDEYVRLSHDWQLPALLNFYKCYRAYVRGKVESFKFDDPYVPEDEKGGVLATAQGYFQLARSYAVRSS